MQSSLQLYLSTYTGISAKDFNLMVPLLEVKHFEKDVRLIEIGEVEDHVHFIERGLMRKFFYCKKKEITVQLAKESELISSSVSFFTGDPSEYIIETIEPSTTLSLSRSNLEKLYSISPGMERVGRLVVADLLIRKERWDNEWNVLTPKNRFNKLRQEHPGLFARAPQKFLASYLSMTPETFSRYKHSLIRE